jgi:hypothetical protein
VRRLDSSDLRLREAIRDAPIGELIVIGPDTDRTTRALKRHVGRLARDAGRAIQWWLPIPGRAPEGQLVFEVVG